jgi:hypothetical protein
MHAARRQRGRHATSETVQKLRPGSKLAPHLKTYFKSYLLGSRLEKYNQETRPDRNVLCNDAI